MIWPMKRNWLILAVVFLTLILVGLVVKSKFFGRITLGALQIDTTPRAVVFVDGSQVGITPFFDDKIEAGEHLVKLVPEATTNNLITWEGKVNLVPNIQTVISRNLGPTESESSGEILSLEKIDSRDQSSLAVVSTPDKAVVRINGQPQRFTPALMENLSPGSYEVVISSQGYGEKTISAKTVAGYKLVINIQLAREIEGIKEATPSAEEEEEEKEEEEEAGMTPTPTPKAEGSPTPEPEKPYVRIKDTPTGWLRVRAEPSTESTSAEVAKADPGETFPYLEEEENGWYKIEYEKGEEGWVSGVYAELVE